MVRIRVKPIIPKKTPIDLNLLRRRLENDLEQVAREGLRFIATYPPQRLTQSGYRRTGTLKRSWSMKTRFTSRRLVATIGSNSNIAPYNRPVQGKPQASIFKAAGWRGVDDLIVKVQNDFKKRAQKTVKEVLR